MKIHFTPYKTPEEIPNDLKETSCGCFCSRNSIYKVGTDYYVVSLNLIDRIVNCILKIFGKDYLQDKIKSSISEKTVSLVNPVRLIPTPPPAQQKPLEPKPTANPLHAISPPASTPPPKPQRVPLRYFTLDVPLSEVDKNQINKLCQSLFNIEPSIEKIEDSRQADVTILSVGNRGYPESIKQNGKSRNYLLSCDGQVAAADVFQDVPTRNWQDIVVQCRTGCPNVIQWNDAESVRDVALLLFRVFSERPLNTLPPDTLKNKTLRYYARPDFSEDDKTHLIRVCLSLGIRLSLTPAHPSQGVDLLVTQVRSDDSVSVDQPLSEMPARQYMLASNKTICKSDILWFLGAHANNRGLTCQAGQSPNIVNWNDPESVRQMRLLFMRLFGNPVYCT